MNWGVFYPPVAGIRVNSKISVCAAFVNYRAVVRHFARSSSLIFLLV